MTTLREALFYEEPRITLYCGDALTVLRLLEPETVQTVVTSPPYWGLRDYGVEGQIGLEATPDEYRLALAAVFSQVMRVLREDGTCWLNLGDSYAATTKGSGGVNTSTLDNGRGQASNAGAFHSNRAWHIPPGLKPKDLVGIPWRVAFTLQECGWYLRSDIIWHKPNPMPESVTDRPTKAHEYLFLLSKGQWSRRVVELTHLPDEILHDGDNARPDSAYVRCYEFCVAVATSILQSPQAQERLGLFLLDSHEGQQSRNGSGRDVITALPAEERALLLAARFRHADLSAKGFLEELHRLGLRLAHRDALIVGGGAAEFPLSPPLYSNHEGSVAVQDSGQICEYDLGRHAFIISRPVGCAYYYDAEVIREKTGNEMSWEEYEARTAPGATWQSGGLTRYAGANKHDGGHSHPAGRNRRSVWTINAEPYPEAHFATFPPDLVKPCVLAGSPLGSIVLDPFSGAGTTLYVAKELGRRAIGIELNPEYCRLAVRRLRQEVLL